MCYRMQAQTTRKKTEVCNGGRAFKSSQRTKNKFGKQNYYVKHNIDHLEILNKRQQSYIDKIYIYLDKLTAENKKVVTEHILNPI